MNDPKAPDNATRRALLARLGTCACRVFALMCDFDAALKEAGIDVDASGFDAEDHTDPLVRAGYWLRSAAITLDQAANLPGHWSDAPDTSPAAIEKWIRTEPTT